MAMTSLSMPELVKVYLGLGLYLIPIMAGGKTPAGPWAGDDWPYDRLMDYLAVHPDANIAVRTGSWSDRVIVVDVDAHGVDGRKTMRAYEEENGELPQTLSVRTPTGGAHLYYRIPEGKPVPGNSVGGLPGVDVRGEGGYAVAPPSSISGIGSYRFLRGREPGEVDIAEADEDVMKLLVKLSHPKSPSLDQSSSFKLAKEGERNQRLYAYACHVRARGGNGDDVAVHAAMFNAVLCSPPLDSREVTSVIRSACSHEPGEDLLAATAGLPELGSPRMGEEEVHHVS